MLDGFALSDLALANIFEHGNLIDSIILIDGVKDAISNKLGLLSRITKIIENIQLQDGIREEEAERGREWGVKVPAIDIDYIHRCRRFRGKVSHVSHKLLPNQT